MARVRDPAKVPELSWSQMYNKLNCIPMVLDLRPEQEFQAAHLHECARIDVCGYPIDQQLNAIFTAQIMPRYELLDKLNCILLIAQADWHAHAARILDALAPPTPRFKRYYRCRCFSETLSFASFLACENPVMGVPSLIECLLNARLFLSGITYATAAIASQLRLSRIINVTPQAPSCPDITACFPIEDSDAADIGPILEQTRPIISTCAQGDLHILVHCHQGISRSASVVIDYVASVKHISADAAMELIRCSRSQVQPNEAFMAQLRRMHPET